MSAIPDGTDRAQYLYLRKLDRGGLMWEWLRRDPAYVGWYVRASTVTGGRPAVPLRWRLLLAENPALPAPQARIFWSADIDPGALEVVARPVHGRARDALPLDRLRPWLSLIRNRKGAEHAALSDGLHRLRLDIEEGTLAGGPVVLHYRLDVLQRAGAKLATVRRLAALCREQHFSAEMFPADPRAMRWMSLLRVTDAVAAGASQRDVADLLFGIERTRAEWHGPSDSLRSRVRRLIGEAAHLASGGYRWLLRR